MEGEECGLSDWSSWSPCTATCGFGTRSRSRTASGDCAGVCLREAETCEDDPCEADAVCVMGDWSAWTECSVSCGSGTKTRSRKVESVKEEAGKCPCTEEADTCNIQCAQSIVSLCGKVKSVVDDTPVPGAIVKFKEWKYKSDDNGEFCFDDVLTLINNEPQEVTLTATKEGWSDAEKTEEFSAGHKVIVEMSPTLGTGEWRFVLVWGTKPIDLDSITEYGPTGNSHCIVDWNAKGDHKHCDHNGMNGILDLDHCWLPEGNCAQKGSESKPETTTIQAKDCVADATKDCTISYKVDNWSARKESDTATLAESKAVVTVYNSVSQGAVATFTVEKDGKVEGFDWFVCTVDPRTNTVKAVQP